jgi:[acyl-carrier-protein] S-malonyltransferase
MNNSKTSSIFAVFPGQGSQHVGMAKDLCDQFSIARQVFEEASEAIHFDLKKICFNGPESDLTLTENTQPSLLAASVAAFRVAQQELNFTPSAVAGHSLGEYSALVAIGALDLATAARWVRERGIAMQRAVPKNEGTMAAILGIDDSIIEKLCEKATDLAQQKRNQGENSHISVPALVEPANFNAPGQIVIAGSVDAVEQAISLIKTDDTFAGGKAIPLSVSAPFHCRLMKLARDRMAELFSQATDAQKPKTLSCPYIPNRTGRLSKESGIIFELLVEQVDHPVLWKQTIHTFLTSQFTTSVEFGPGKVLAGLTKRIAAHHKMPCALASVGDTASLKNLETLLKTSPVS